MKNGLLIPPVPPCGFRAAEGESRYSLCLRPSSWHSVWSLIIHGRRRKNVSPVRQADRGWTGPGRGPIRAACPGAAGHQPLPGVRRLDVTVVRPAPPRPAAGARGPTHRTTGRHVASPSPSRPPSASPAPAVAEKAKEVDPRGRRDRLRVSHVHHSHACGLSGLEVNITRLLSSGWRFPILRGARSGAGAAGDRRPKRGAA